MEKSLGKNKVKIFTLTLSLVLLSVILIQFVFASDVAYLYVRKFNVDQNITKFFNEKGLSVDLIQEKNITKVDFSKYKFIFVGDERFTNPELIPINKYPTVIANYYHGPVFGLTDSDGISQLGRTEPQSVNIDGSIIQVYTQGLFGLTRVAIPYYYLGNDDKAPQMMQVAGTYSGPNHPNSLGDVISYANPGIHLQNGKIAQKNICFFGIVESAYWTDDAKQMFDNCIDFVISGCSRDSDCGNSIIGDNYCSDSSVDKNITQPKCMNPGTINSKCVNTTVVELVEKCSDICSDGTCSIAPCHNNSECGTSGLFDGLFCQNNNVFQNSITFTCNNPNTQQSFCTNSTYLVLQNTCANNQVCINAVCVNINPGINCSNDSQCNDNNISTFDKCNNPGTPQSFCTNTPVNCVTNQDCGVTGFVGSPICSNNDVFKNFQNSICVNAGTPNSFCQVQRNLQIVTDCGDNTCDGGNNYCVGNAVYLNQSCTQRGCDSGDCFANNYSNPIFVQTCTFGCSNGTCNQPPISCHNDNDCGATGFIGSEFCSEDNVFKFFQNSTCINPGTPNSFCQLQKNPVIVFNCGVSSCTNNGNFCMGNTIFQNQTCLNKGCDSGACFTNPSNSHIVPVQNCTPNQTCTNGQCVTNCDITCNLNSDCGINGFVGNTFCQNGNVYQNFTTHTCNNIGTCSAFCSGTTNSQLKQACLPNQICSNGQCMNQNIICINDSQCDDDNLYTVDKCNNPGTSSSFCSHTVVNCVTNNDCGPTGFIGSEFCSNDNVFKINQSSVCVNPGTSSSFCQVFKSSIMVVDCGSNSCGNFGNNYCKGNNVFHTRTCFERGCDGGACFSMPNSVDEELVMNCASGCLNGNCINQVINCTQNSDCNDNNQHTQDICNNPGTSSSFCSHTPINCINNSECGTNMFIDGTFCQNNDVFQNFLTFTCNNAGTQNSFCSSSINDLIKQDCDDQTQTCSNGQCSNQTITCSQNSDCGINGATGSPFCQGNSLFENLITYTCNNPGTPQSSCSNSILTQLNKTCAQNQVCFNGMCNNQTITCNQNSDCGINGATGSPFCQGNSIFQNFISFTCNNPGTQQSFCSNSINSVLNQTCLQNQFCNNGLCNNQNIPCFNDSQCNDNNQHTLDKCNNPGTPQSFCTNTFINCFNSSDCGISGPFDGLFCINNNIFQNFLTFTCNNPGTIQSSCSLTNSPQLNQTCGQGQTCNNGNCVNINITCSKNSDCGTNAFVNGLFCQGNSIFQNFQTFTCNNPGTQQSSCSSSVSPFLNKTCAQNQFCNNGVCVNQTIICNQDSDCGINSVIGSLFCQGSSIFQNFLTYTCNNPGTPQSSCSSSVSQTLNQTCLQGQTCNDGQCSNQTIPCSQNSDCGIDGVVGDPFCEGNSTFQNFITHTCHNPGTPQSFCSDSTSPQLNQTCFPGDTCSNGQCIPPQQPIFTGTSCKMKDGSVFDGTWTYWDDEDGNDFSVVCKQGNMVAFCVDSNADYHTSERGAHPGVYRCGIGGVDLTNLNTNVTTCQKKDGTTFDGTWSYWDFGTGNNLDNDFSVVCKAGKLTAFCVDSNVNVHTTERGPHPGVYRCGDNAVDISNVNYDTPLCEMRDAKVFDGTWNYWDDDVKGFAGNDFSTICKGYTFTGFCLDEYFPVRGAHPGVYSC